MRRYPTRSNPGATVVSGGSVSPVHSLEKQGTKRVGKKGTQILEFNAVQIARAKQNRFHSTVMCHFLPMGTSQEITNCRS